VYRPAIERALRVAHEAHAGQTRKGGGLPYVLHPIHVALILAGCNASEDVIVAALLHDVVEDCEDWDLDRMQAEFGARVRSILDEVTENKDLAWEERKQAAIDHVPHLSPEALLVKAADKLHNLSSLLADLRAADDPDDVWRPFTRGPAQTLRMSRTLVEALVPHLDAALGKSLTDALEALEALPA